MSPQNDWQRVSHGILHRSPTITDGGVMLGCATILVHRSYEGYELQADSERCLCLLSLVRRRAQSPAALHCLRRALASWQQGDKALAHIYLAFGQLPTIDSLEEARRLHQAEGLLNLGMTPRALAKELGFDWNSSELSKVFNPDEPRNPKHSGDVGGRWTKDPVASGSIAFAPAPIPAPPSKPSASPIQQLTTALSPAPAVPSLVGALGAEAMEWLNDLVGRLALPAALYGAIFVPSPNSGISEQGAVPGRAGMSYHLDRDTGTLRLSLDSDANPENALVALLGTDGVYREAETRVPIARAVGSKAVIIDLDLAPVAIGGGAEGSGTNSEEPKPCPDPSKDQGGGRRLFDILYEQWVRNFVNPQRKPQLPPGIAFSLPAQSKSGRVNYDDCREATGAMIEAKGNYAGMLRSQSKRKILERKWLDQAKRQISGLTGRPLEWYFHDPEAATFARKIFLDAGYDKHIKTFVLPFPGGVPFINPRVK